jgi:hypothetical protein
MALWRPSLANGQSVPVSLVWITNSTVKLEQIIGDYDWAALAQGSNVPTASQTVSRFHILGNGLGYSFEDKGKLIFLFGDTISETVSNWNYHAADPLAWSTTASGESPLLLNFFTNNPVTNALTEFTPIFVQPAGIKMGPFDIPNSGISLSNGVFLVCNTGADANNTNDVHAAAYSVLVTFNETNLLSATNTFATDFFVTNRIISMLNTNLDPASPMQGHFIFTSQREFGTNVVIFGVGAVRASDVYLSMVPTANFLSGNGTLYFTGLTNGQPTWSAAESNAVPVVQDNPTNGPPWPNDNPAVGNVSVIYSTNLSLWLMNYDGGGNTGKKNKDQTTGIYFSAAPKPWGPWSQPQLIFNKYRDNADGVFIYDAKTQTGPAGPTISPTNNPPDSTEGGDFAPIMIERFTTVLSNTLTIYYTMSTWNPYTVVKMRSQFLIVPQIDPGTLVYKKNKFSFAWSAPTNGSYQVDYSSNLLAGWTEFTNIITSTNGIFNFTNDETHNGGLPPLRFYRLRTTP